MKTSPTTAPETGRPAVKPRSRLKALRREMWKQRAAYLFLLPKMILFVAFIVLPVIWAFFISFQEFGIFESEWVGVDNYVATSKTKRS